MDNRKAPLKVVLFLTGMSLCPVPSTFAAPVTSAEEKADNKGDDRKMLDDFTKAISRGDLKAIKSYHDLSDEVEGSFVEKCIEIVVRRNKNEGRAPDLQLVYAKRVSEKILFALYFGTLLPGAEPRLSPMPFIFHRIDGQWKTRLFNFRTVIQAREMGPFKIARRSILDAYLDLRFGEISVDESLTLQLAQMEGFEALSKPPFNQPQYGPVSKEFREEIRMLRDSSLETFLSVVEEKIVDPAALKDDFYLSFYLEAKEGQKHTTIPFSSSDKQLSAERLPCLTEDHIQSAQLERFPDRGGYSVGFRLTKSGKRLFGNVTKRNLKRRLAMVVEGKVISAPVIQSEIAGGRGVISGNFSRGEAQTIVDRLNAYRQKAKEYLRSLEEKRDAEKQSSKKASTREF